MIRTANDQDIPLIQSVLNAPENLSKLEAYADEEIQAAIHDPNTPVFVWSEEEIWQGFCWLKKSEEGTKIEELGVVTPGGGLGTRFLGEVVRQAKECSLPVPIWLNVAADNSDAIRFYERFGFVRNKVKKAVWVRRKGAVADVLKMILSSH